MTREAWDISDFLFGGDLFGAGHHGQGRLGIGAGQTETTARSSSLVKAAFGPEWVTAPRLKT